MPTLEQIQAKLKKLQAQADVLIARKAQLAVDQIRDLMLKHGLTTADIEAKAKAKRDANALHGRHANGKAKAAAKANGNKLPKYRDDKTGATWTGHGRAPGWIAGVKDRTPFLVEGASEQKSAVKASVTRAAAGRKGQPKGKQPPKYRDPKTGATWSGRGPAPAWLSAARDRSKFLIDSTAATSGTVSTKAAAKKGATAKKATVSKTVAKKTAAAAKKVAAKKGAAKPAARKTATKTATAGRAAKKAPGRKARSEGNAGAATTAAPATSTAQTGA
ncbi:H-NS histone family protein [Paraburkholderia lacunae]|uniref:Nucleoid-structuring protein H-NS n=1 Tax=Paraburkholderia lacunae TaxID=2211104 RepID=A0A370NBU3_9BURK|nr:H-NS family nucleoid-associated regulatory protein [Paraburkholderia lacunae]RDK03070.1 nucleoid-structuring protein H-NS [Paraburkholderia lacunae]